MFAAEERLNQRSPTMGIMPIVGIAVVMFAMLVASTSPRSALIIVVPVGAATLLWLVRYTALNRQWLITALLLNEMLLSSGLLPIAEDQRPMLRYPLTFMFCLPILIPVLRSGVLLKGGFKYYALYLAWCFVSVGYSLLPVYSAGRAIGSTLLFMACASMVVEVEDRDSGQRLIRNYFIGGAIVMALTAAVFVWLPRTMTWSQPQLWDDTRSFLSRFQGIFGTPNQMGEAMLATVGAGLAFWPSASRNWRRVIGVTVAAAFVFGGLADSRSSFLAIMMGIVTYLVWRYRARGLLICVGLGAMLALAATMIDPDYITRGDIGTLTGRSEVWDFSIRSIKDHPILGFGYEVEGQILKSKYFSSWALLWDEGPRSSLHNGYIARMVGVGVPAFLFWCWLFFRSWIWLFRQQEDPWNLKPIALLIMIPLVILNMSESTAMDGRASVGLLGLLIWCLIEKYRVAATEAEAIRRIAEPAYRPPVIAALRGAS